MCHSGDFDFRKENPDFKTHQGLNEEGLKRLPLQRRYENYSTVAKDEIEVLPDWEVPETKESKSTRFLKVVCFVVWFCVFLAVFRMIMKNNEVFWKVCFHFPDVNVVHHFHFALVLGTDFSGCWGVLAEVARWVLCLVVIGVRFLGCIWPAFSTTPNESNNSQTVRVSKTRWFAKTWVWNSNSCWISLLFWVCSWCFCSKKHFFLLKTPSPETLPLPGWGLFSLGSYRLPADPTATCSGKSSDLPTCRAPFFTPHLWAAPCQTTSEPIEKTKRRPQEMGWYWYVYVEGEKCFGFLITFSG